MKKNKEQFTKVAHNLKQIKENTKRQTPITFGVTFTAPYALVVHEDLETPHTTGQAKFLEQPLRMYAKQMTQRVKDKVKRKKATLKQAMLEEGNWLLEEAKKLCPVDKGILRDSGLVKIIS